MALFVSYKHQTIAKKNNTYNYYFHIAFIHSLEDWKNFCFVANFQLSNQQVLDSFLLLKTDTDINITLPNELQAIVHLQPNTQEFIPFVISEKGNLVIQFQGKEFFLHRIDAFKEYENVSLNDVEKPSFFNILRSGVYFTTPSFQMKHLLIAWNEAILKIKKDNIEKNTRKKLAKEEYLKCIKIKEDKLQKKLKKNEALTKTQEAKPLFFPTATTTPEKLTPIPPTENTEKPKRKRIPKPF